MWLEPAVNVTGPAAPGLVALGPLRLNSQLSTLCLGHDPNK